MKYVAGFLFAAGKVLLVKKSKPLQLAGKWNGIGGKVNNGDRESSIEAMIREFHEETGQLIQDWTCFCTLKGSYALNGTDEEDFSVDFYYSSVSSSALITKLVNDCGEELCWFYLDSPLLCELVLPNVNWLLPMAHNFQRGERAKRFCINEEYV